MAEVYLDMVRKVMGPTVFSAMEVGYTLQLNVNPRGVVLRFGGLTDDDIILQLLSITTLSESLSGGQGRGGGGLRREDLVPPFSDVTSLES